MHPLAIKHPPSVEMCHRAIMRHALWPTMPCAMAFSRKGQGDEIFLPSVGFTASPLVLEFRPRMCRIAPQLEWKLQTSGCMLRPENTWSPMPCPTRLSHFLQAQVLVDKACCTKKPWPENPVPFQCLNFAEAACLVSRALSMGGQHCMASNKASASGL